MVGKYGSDAFRLYLEFGFSYVEGGPWSDKGLESIVRFMDRVERLVRRTNTYTYNANSYGPDEKELDYTRNFAIKCVTADIENFSFNTAVARLMEFSNVLIAYDNKFAEKNKLFKESVRDLVLLLAPFAPHFAEELNEVLGNKKSVFKESFPVVNEAALVKDEVELAVQINSRVRAKIVVPNGLSQKEIEEFALKDANVVALLNGETPKKIIVIPKRLINFVL
jgi:Leucyl-tRNA synthetase